MISEKVQSPVCVDYNNAGSHNAIYRGKNLGTSVTAAQYAAIAAGTFDDMFIGDYWVIGGVTWRIAAFDYWINNGDPLCTTHHIVIVPDSRLYNAQMHNTESGSYEAGDANTTTGGYVATDMYLTGLDTAKTTITNAFGSDHILTHREYLSNAASNGYVTGNSWYDSTVELMNEIMLYGTTILENAMQGTNFASRYTIDKSQLPLFRHRHDLIGNRATWWLRSVASKTHFCFVDWNGNAKCENASNSLGVRPAFGIC